MIVGDLLGFDLRLHPGKKTGSTKRDVPEDYVVLEIVGPDDQLTACKWHLSAGRQEVAEALRRLADRLEGKL